jgi:hypothetical protein
MFLFLCRVLGVEKLIMYVNPGPWVQASANSALTGPQPNVAYADLGNVQDTVDFSNSRSSIDPSAASEQNSPNNANCKKKTSLPTWLLAIGGGALAIGAGILLKKGGFRFKNSNTPKNTSSHSHGALSSSNSVEKSPSLLHPTSPRELTESLKIERNTATQFSVEKGYAKEWAEFQNNPEALKQLKNGISQTLNHRRYLGKGSFAYAYSIPHASRYQFASPVLRVEPREKLQLSKKANEAHLQIQQHLFKKVGQKRFSITNTHQVQVAYKVLPIKYGPESKSMLESDDIGLPFAAIIPEGHPAYSREFIQPKELESVKGTLLRQVDGQKLSRRDFNRTFDKLGAQAHYKEEKLSLESKQKKTALTDAEFKDLVEANEQINKAPRYQLIDDMRAYQKANPKDPNFEHWKMDEAQYSQDELAQYKEFREKYLLEMQKLGDMPESVASDIMRSLKAIKESGANFDFSHGANLFIKRTQNPETGKVTESWKFIDLALTDAEKGKAHTYNPYGIDDFVNVAMGKNSWGRSFLPSRFISDLSERQEMQENVNKFLSRLEKAAQIHGITDKDGQIWTADRIRAREGIKKD